MTDQRYTLGYSDAMSRYMARRRAATHAAFFVDCVRPQWRILDCGCGPGTITIDLARIASEGQVDGVDCEASQVERARALAHRSGIRNISFEAHDVCQLPAEDDSFDAVLAHAVLSHVENPQVALREWGRVLKPGGLLGVRDADWDGNVAAPINDTLVVADDLFAQLVEAGGSDLRIGRKLPQLLAEAGFESPRFNARYEVFVDDDLRDYVAGGVAFWSLDRVVAGAKQLGALEPAGIKSIKHELIAFAEHPHAFYAHAWFEILANKPVI